MAEFVPSINRPLPMPDGVTAEMETNYLNNVGERCLFCESEEVKCIQENETPVVIFDRAEVILPMECRDCGQKWQDVYQMVRVEACDE